MTDTEAQAESKTPSEKGEGQYAALLQAATKLIRDKGPTALSLRAVANEVGVAVGTVQYHFGNKEGLVEAILDAPYASWKEDIAEALSKGFTEPEALIEWAIPRIYASLKNYKEAARLNVLHIAERGRFHPRRVQTFSAPALGQIGGIMAATLGIGETDARLLLHTAAMTITRFAITEPQDLRLMLNLPDDTSNEELDRQVESFLTRLCKLSLQLPAG